MARRAGSRRSHESRIASASNDIRSTSRRSGNSSCAFAIAAPRASNSKPRSSSRAARPSAAFSSAAFEVAKLSKRDDYLAATRSQPRFVMESLVAEDTEHDLGHDEQHHGDLEHHEAVVARHVEDQLERLLDAPHLLLHPHIPFPQPHPPAPL